MHRCPLFFHLSTGYNVGIGAPNRRESVWAPVKSNAVASLKKKKRELTQIIGAERDVYNSKQYQVVGQWFLPLSLSPFTSKAGQSQTRNIG